MRIAIVHSFYTSDSSSGENQIVESQIEILKQSGYEVKLIASHSDDLLRSKWDLLNAGLRVATGIGHNPLSDLKTFQPDITIVHNLHPNYGSKWMADWDGPIVRVLHNFRLYCASATFFRDGTLCQDCLEISPLQGLKNSCYKNSRMATLPLTLAQIRRVVSNIEIDAVDVFIALSESSKSILVDSKLPESLIRVIPNFIEDPYEGFFSKLCDRNGRWIAAGRLSQEKGFIELIEAWPAEHKLDLVGQGPLASEIARLAERKPNIRLLGKLDNSTLLARLPFYTGAIFPSLCFENAPIVAIEYLSAGLPIITTSVSSVSSLVHNSRSGTVIEHLENKQLSLAIQEVMENHQIFCTNSRTFFEENFTSENWARKMKILFSEIMAKQ